MGGQIVNIQVPVAAAPLTSVRLPCCIPRGSSTYIGPVATATPHNKQAYRDDQRYYGSGGDVIVGGSWGGDGGYWAGDGMSGCGGEWLVRYLLSRKSLCDFAKC